jgi:hypothetical protein
VDEDVHWTIDELAARVAAELAVDYPGAPSGRVRDVPDRRAIRWYTTIGLVDRPLGMRGRTALYGPRHLLQLVAVKRRQAAGRSLAEIQAELTGATDRTLREIARPAGQPPSAAAAADPVGAAAGGGGPVVAEAGQGGGRRAPARFWAARAASPDVADAGTGPAVPAVVDIGAETGPAVVGPGSGPLPAAAEVVHGVALAGGVTLVLPAGRRVPSGDDLAAIEVAAGPLLEVLVRRGLVAGAVREDGAGSGDSGRSGGS